MTVTINVTNITVLSLRSGPDRITLWTTLPSGIHTDTQDQTLEATVARGTGEDYVQRHFPGIPVEVIRQ